MKRELSIYRTLKKLSKQRVALILQPGNVWVIEKAIPDNDETEENLITCHLRGWVEPIKNAIPKGKLLKDGSLPEGNVFSKQGPIYRLTDSGWGAIHRTYVIALLGLVVSLLALGISVIAIKL